MKLRHIILFFLLALASRESIAGVDSILVTVDTLCSSWHVCVNDARVLGGIKSVILLNDTNGIIVQPPEISYNVLLDRSFDLLGTGKVDFSSDTKNICFVVLVDSISKNGYAALLIIDNQDSQKIINLKFKEFGYQYNSYNTLSKYIGGIAMNDQRYFTDIFYFPNSSSRSSVLKSVYFKNNSIFTIIEQAPTNDSLITSNVIVSFNVSPKDTGIFYDTLVCETECITLERGYKVIGGCGIIYTHDTDVGEVVIGREAEFFPRIENRGYFPLTIYNGLIYSNGDISFKPFTAPSLSLQLTIETNSSYYAKLTYKPTKLGIDSAIIVCKTGSPDPYKHSIKDTMQIRGRGVLPQLVWNKSEGRILADSASMQILNLTLTNNEKFSIDVKRFYISGEDSAEFSISNSLIPLQNVSIIPNESDWFTIGFLPDMNKSIATRYENRHATLNIETEYYTIPLPLIAGFGLNKTKRELALDNFSFSPNPVYGQDATLSFKIAEPKQLAVSIYDILGREVMTLPSQYYPSGSFSNTIGTSKLGDGSYILRVSDGGATKSISFRVIR